MTESNQVALIAAGCCVYVRQGAFSEEYVCLFNSSRDREVEIVRGCYSSNCWSSVGSMYEKSSGTTRTWPATYSE